MSLLNEAHTTIDSNTSYKAIIDKDENLNTINEDNLNNNISDTNKLKTNLLSTLNNNNNSNNANTNINSNSNNKDTVFTLKKWNLVAMWSWDVECEVCAICRTPLMDSCLKCQTDNKHDDCVVVWGDCNHSFHNCCMSQWIKSRNFCPLCQSEWHVQRIGR